MPDLLRFSLPSLRRLDATETGPVAVTLRDNGSAVYMALHGVNLRPSEMRGEAFLFAYDIGEWANVHGFAWQIIERLLSLLPVGPGDYYPAFDRDTWPGRGRISESGSGRTAGLPPGLAAYVTGVLKSGGSDSIDHAPAASPGASYGPDSMPVWLL